MLCGARAQLQQTSETMNFDYRVPEDPVIPREPDLQEELIYWDDSKGGYLDPKVVRLARQEEIN